MKKLGAMIQSAKLKTKLMFMMFVVTLASVLLCVVSYIPDIIDITEENAENNLLNHVTSSGRFYEELLKEKKTLTTEDYASILSDVTLKGLESSYAYLVAPDGTMLYHKTADKIGKPVENSVVNRLVNDIKNGIYREPEFIQYDYNGVAKYAAHCISPTDHTIIVVTVDEDDVMASIPRLFLSAAFMLLFIMAVVLILGYLTARLMSKPLTKMTVALKKVSDFDLSAENIPKELLPRKDENGIMCNALNQVSVNIREMVQQIAKVSGELSDNAGELLQIANNVNEFSADNSATSEQLSASMEETAATTDVIDDSITEIKANAGEINNLASDGENMASEIKSRANDVKSEAEEANRKSREICASIEKRTNEAVERAKSIQKIHELTEVIREIASQTSLLSLNASIEAARAGESGRGFAVVASEIGSLATQSTNTVDNISQIVSEVQTVADNMTSCLTEVLDYIKGTVLSDYEKLINVSGQYFEDASKFQSFMHNINSAVDSLDGTIKEVAQAVNGINITITEAASGVTDIAKKTSDTVELTGKTSTLATMSVEYAKNLQDAVAKFRY